jgi:hypothetical protein
LKEKYLDELKLEEKLKLIVNDPDIDKSKIQKFIFQIDSCKDHRKYIAKKMKKLVTTFPRLAPSLDFLRDQMLKEADKRDEVVELNPQYIIRRTNEIVPRLYSKQADILDRIRPSKLNKKDWHVISNHFTFHKIPEYMEQIKRNIDKEDNINNIRIEKERHNKIQYNKIRHKILRLEIQKQRIITELENTVLMSDFYRHAHNEHINRIEHE